jgi:quercetin dioxygenase-like cupin family protein
MRKRFPPKITELSVAVLLFSSSVFAQKYTPAFPRDGAKRAAESDWFAIWDVTIENGKSAGMHENSLDQVTVFLTDGAVKFSRPDGTWAVEQERLGSVRYEPKGTVEAEENIGEKPCRAMVFLVKDTASPQWPTMDGVPNQLPRAGAIKLFETDRFIVWDHRFWPGVPGERHLHYHPTVGVYLEGGKTQVTPDPINGVTPPSTTNTWELGHIVNGAAPLRAPHREEELEGIPHVIYVQLK